MAMLEAKVAMVYFLKRFDIKLADGYQMKWTMKFLVEHVDPLEVILNKGRSFDIRTKDS